MRIVLVTKRKELVGEVVMFFSQEIAERGAREVEMGERGW